MNVTLHQIVTREQVAPFKKVYLLLLVSVVLCVCYACLGRHEEAKAWFVRNELRLSDLRSKYV